jgi:hypothetical protein
MPFAEYSLLSHCCIPLPSCFMKEFHTSDVGEKVIFVKAALEYAQLIELIRYSTIFEHTVSFFRIL